MRTRFTIRQLEYFIAVCETGSVVAAAHKINVSAPSISTSVMALEDELGVKMFVRQHGRGLTLTSAGRSLYEKSRQLLKQADEIREVAGDYSNRAYGPINVACMITIAPMVLVALRKSFQAEYPNARVSMLLGDQPRLFDLLYHAEADVAITYDMQIPHDFEFIPLAELPPFVYVSANHRLAKQNTIKLKELEAEPMVLLDLPISRDYFLSIFQNQGIVPTIAERTESLSVLRSLVANGPGFALSNLRPRSSTVSGGGELVNLHLDGEHQHATLGLAMATSQQKSRVLLAFIEHCRSEVNDMSIPGMAPPI